MQKKTTLITSVLVGSLFLQGFSFDKMIDKVTDFKKFKNPSGISTDEINGCCDTPRRISAVPATDASGDGTV